MQKYFTPACRLAKRVCLRLTANHSTPVWPRPRRQAALILAAAIGVLTTTPSHAQLTWEQREVAQQATAFDLTKQFVFPFRNDGDHPVTITSLTSSCGCTTATLETDRYAPGDGGAITATFDIGDRRGPQTKTLTVRTDDPRSPVIKLVVKLDIAQVIELKPRLLLWRKGEARTPKTVEIVVHRPDLLTLQPLKTPTPPFTLTWHPPPEAAPPEAPPEAQTPQPEVPLEVQDRPAPGEASGGGELPGAGGEGLPTIYRVVVHPPADGSAQKAVVVLQSKNPLPEGVTLPRLVLRTLGPPAPATNE